MTIVADAGCASLTLRVRAARIAAEEGTVVEISFLRCEPFTLPFVVHGNANAGSWGRQPRHRAGAGVATIWGATGAIYADGGPGGGLLSRAWVDGLAFNASVDPQCDDAASRRCAPAVYWAVGPRPAAQ